MCCLSVPHKLATQNKRPTRRYRLELSELRSQLAAVMAAQQGALAARCERRRSVLLLLLVPQGS